jgi:hypothetical protein
MIPSGLNSEVFTGGKPPKVCGILEAQPAPQRLRKRPVMLKINKFKKNDFLIKLPLS